MKRFFRSAPVVAVLGRLIWLWMVTISATVRWTVEGEESARAAWAEAPGAIIASWHRGIMLMPSGWRRHMSRWPGRQARIAMIVSLSPDGEAIGRAVQMLDIDLIRGSSGNKKKIGKDKGGVVAVIESARRLKENGCVCITLDGPRGPAEQVTAGTIFIAQRAGAGILPYAISSTPAFRANSWDRFLLPLPFTRGAIVFGPMLRASPELDPEALRLELQARMDTASARAEVILHGARVHRRSGVSS